LRPKEETTRARRAHSYRRAHSHSRAHSCLLALLAAAALFACAARASAQGGGHTLYGDLRVDETKVEGAKPLSFDIILYSDNGNVVGRQSIPNGGRYRFLNLSNGWYNVAVEVEGNEVARLRVQVMSTFKNDFRQDIALAWRERPGAGRPSSVAADAYKRAPANQKLFDRAAAAMNSAKYEEAEALFRQIVEADANDYQAWTELGTACIFRQNADEAEKAYARATEAKPTYTPALVNLGRLRVMEKKFDAGVGPLEKAVAQQPDSPDANLLLGECYLQLRKGSKAVPHLEAAARLGRPEARLRLAKLYDLAGMKDRAAAEYGLYLAAKPDAPDRKRLEEYIKENKKK
jgi:tetratricopeptide (TPR) repeat protein